MDGVQLERLEIYKKNHFGSAAWLEGLLMTLTKNQTFRFLNVVASNQPNFKTFWIQFDPKIIINMQSKVLLAQNVDRR